MTDSIHPDQEIEQSIMARSITYSAKKMITAYMVVMILVSGFALYEIESTDGEANSVHIAAIVIAISYVALWLVRLSLFRKFDVLEMRRWQRFCRTVWVMFLAISVMIMAMMSINSDSNHSIFQEMAIASVALILSVPFGFLRVKMTDHKDKLSVLKHLATQNPQGQGKT